MTQEQQLEDLCRIICRAEKVDPDKEGIGIGQHIPQGQPYKMWEIRKHIAIAILAAGYAYTGPDKKPPTKRSKHA